VVPLTDSSARRPAAARLRRDRLVQTIVLQRGHLNDARNDQSKTEKRE
jgi:hypothetical protein